MRHALVTYHQQDVDPREVIVRTEIAHENRPLDRRGRLDELHGGACYAMEEMWGFKGDALSHLKNLTTLDIDIMWLYCAMGCCRDVIVESLLNDLKIYFYCLPPELEIRIHGIRGKKEDDNAKEWRRAMLKTMKEYKAEKMEKAKANIEKAKIEMGEAEVEMEMAEFEMEEAKANMEKIKANMELVKANMEKAKANMEEAMKQNA